MSFPLVVGNTAQTKLHPQIVFINLLGGSDEAFKVTTNRYQQAVLEIQHLTTLMISDSVDRD